MERSGSTKLLGYPLQSRWCLKVEIVLSSMYALTFSSKVDLLSDSVPDTILVLCLPTSHHCRNRENNDNIVTPLQPDYMPLVSYSGGRGGVPQLLFLPKVLSRLLLIVTTESHRPSCTSEKEGLVF